jgi:hypothetical protein
MRLYKYIPARYAESLLDGAVRFSTLAYYRQHEAKGSIGDADEATRVFRPPEGLDVTNLTTGQRFRLPATFRSSARAELVFVFCVSRVLDANLAAEFGCDACVEVADGEEFGNRLKAAVERLPGQPRFLQGPVAYYDSAEAPGVDWALPQRMVFSKPACYSRQAEYRFAFGQPEVFEPSATNQALVRGEPPQANAVCVPQPEVVDIGNMRDFAAVVPRGRLTSGCS